MLFTTPKFNANKTVGRVKHLFGIKVEKLDVVILLSHILSKSKTNNYGWIELRLSNLDKLTVHYVEIIMALVHDKVVTISDYGNEYKFKIRLTEEYSVGEQKVNLIIKDDRRIKQIKKTR